MPEFRTYAEMIAEANYPATEGTYAALAERLRGQRDRYADALRDIRDEAEGTPSKHYPGPLLPTIYKAASEALADA